LGFLLFNNMKLLFEGWRKFLKEEDEQEYDYDAEMAKEREELEQKHFGASANIGQMLYDIYQEELVNLEGQGMAFDDILDEHDNIFDYIQTKFNKLSTSNKITSNILENSGRGAFRAVFSCDKDFVIKIDASVDGSGKDMNQEDFKLGTNRKYGEIFPRVFKHDPDFKWIVAEKVTPIKEAEPINNKFPTNLLRQHLVFSHGYLTTVQAAIGYKVAQMKGDKQIMQDYIDGFDKKKTSLAVNSYVTLEKLIKDFNKNPLFFKIVSAVFEHGIEVEDSIRPHNMGIGSDGRLVILDSSIAATLDKGRQAIP
jgi:hypothetical protein